MILFLLSVFGLIISDKILYRLEKFKSLFPKNRKNLLYLLNLPTFILLFFKDHQLLLLFYIGVMLAFLITIRIYFEKKLKKVFFTTQIHIIEAISLQIKSGKSIQSAFSEVILALKPIEKMIYEPLLSEKMIENIKYNDDFKQFYTDLSTISKSNTKILEQLNQYKSHLKMKLDLRHKSRVALTQIRSQAVIASVLYIILFLISWTQLDLQNHPVTIFVSIMLWSAGIFIIFKLGEKIKWSL